MSDAITYRYGTGKTYQTLRFVLKNRESLHQENNILRNKCWSIEKSTVLGSYRFLYLYRILCHGTVAHLTQGDIACYLCQSVLSPIFCSLLLCPRFYIAIRIYASLDLMLSHSSPTPFSWRQNDQRCAWNQHWTLCLSCNISLSSANGLTAQ